MATGTSPRANRPATGSTATRGLTLVVCAFLIGVFLIVRGGGEASTADPERQLRATTTESAGTGSTTTAPPNTVVAPAVLNIVAANGYKADNKLAGKTRNRLSALGYSAVRAVNATQEVGKTVVYVASGFEVDAKELLKKAGFSEDSIVAMPADLSTVPVNNLGEAKVAIVLGPDAPDSTAATTTSAPK